MRHLSEQEFIDIAEGIESESSKPHLQSCETCRAKLSDLRSMLSEAADVAVPEPSPLFWDHLSARVRESIANETTESAAHERGRWTWWLVPAGVLAAAVLAVIVTVTPRSQSTSTPNGGLLATDSLSGSDDPLSLADDPSLTLIADMAGDIDYDAAAEAGLTGTSGTIDRAVLALTPDERSELQRILKEEMSKS